ncbi:hypothetical protein PGAG_00051 [Phaeocystis globosa virus 12T]|uniref:Uncharacterized protein n=1 Tax=Phaeocystis globosa virus PgV-16T TaxID=3071227 RepID=A0AC59EWV2_9VIRU|nr:hypothetical protein PGCG_00091 [Phaeocystis globosa virus]AET72941.1 hypothetical protein PGAG_00051 [Phaeocystis globosa virus 12T]AET73759.1 hypothetical protein PGBG_00051 [Phaeocystis globosa virus 14T]AGM15403.1 hypothetical protein PGCG_00091 [Phaeocystis globosa virus PgV-16T]UYE94133.1 hypothetical protein PGV14T_00091 [Phaeocystis globosa virus]
MISDEEVEEYERGRFQFKHLPYSDCIDYDDDELNHTLNELRCDSIVPEIDTIGKKL